MSDHSHREIILECAKVGNFLRVTAVDALTGTEVVFQAPSYASQTEIRNLAVNKLTYVMRTKKI